MRPSMSIAFMACSFAVLVSSAGSALAQPFTYTYYPATTTIGTPVTTDFAIIGFSGGQYNPDTFEREFTGPSSPTVQIGTGADIPDAEIFNNSIVNITGGTSIPITYDQSRLNVYGGLVTSTLGLDSSVINVYGGAVQNLDGQCQHVNILGGALGTVSANSQTAYTGDNLGSCTVDIMGGVFDSGRQINAFNDGILNLYGGTVANLAFLRAAEGGTLNIYGTNLAAQLINSSDPNGYSIYTLAGLLTDGSSIDGVQLKVRNDGVTYGHSTFNLITVPAPSGASVLAAWGVLARRRRR
jgi:hypothetical protein